MKTVLNICVRYRVRRLRQGSVVQKRYVLDYKDPSTGRRHQLFFARRKDAEDKRLQLLRLLELAPTAPPVARCDAVGTLPTVRVAVDNWLAGLSRSLKASTIEYYYHIARYIVEPIVVGSPTQRRRWSRSGRIPPEAQRLPTLGEVLLSDLTTQSIRNWHSMLVVNVGQHTANSAKKVLGSCLRVWGEELSWSPPALPRTIARRKGERSRKRVLAADQINTLMQHAWNDEERGIYYAFPFLTGVRPSEQLGLLWRDVDLGNGVIRVRRMQELDGRLCDFTKTESSARDIPIGPLLRQFLERWQLLTPTRAQPESRVFVTLGTARSRRHASIGAPLTYWNFVNSYWRPSLRRIGLPPVAPHSARHAFISLLQAHGAEVGVVAKLAGHANPNVTLGYYTRAVRDGLQPIMKMEQAFLGARTAD